MEDINKNLNEEQKRSIDNQDVTKTTESPVENVIDAEVLESEPVEIPEQTVQDNLEPIINQGEVIGAEKEERLSERERARQAKLEADKQVQNQESIVRALGEETLGRGQVEAQALADAGISETQQEIDALDSAILASSKALKQARVKDEQDVQSLAGQGRGIPASVVRGRQSLLRSQRLAERKMDAIDLENDIATSQLLQGKVDSARKAIERATKLKFEDKKAELQLEKEWLSRTDSKLAEAKQKELNAIEKEEQEENEIFAIAEEAKNAGATAEELKAIFSSKNRAEALSKLKLPNEEKAETEVIKIDGNDVLIDSQTGRVINDFSDYRNATKKVVPGVSDPVYQAMIDSAGGDKLEQGFVENLSKATIVIDQLDQLSTLFKFDNNGDFKFEVKNAEGEIEMQEFDGGELGQILGGRLKGVNPFNKEGAEIKALLQGIVPNLARGIYGEVGVLTDTDIDNYKQTLPNLTQTDDIKKSLTAMTLETVGNSIKAQLELFASTGRDVSGLVDNLERIEGKIGTIMEPIFMENSPEVKSVISAGADKEDVSALLKKGFKPREIQEMYDRKYKARVTTEEDTPKIMSALRERESSNNYSARGPEIKSGMYKGQRALGAYQVMPGNLPQWSREVFGREISEQEFLESKELQDELAVTKLVQNYNKFGSWEDALSVWHSGRPLAKAQKSSDGLTKTPDYVAQIMNNIKLS